MTDWIGIKRPEKKVEESLSTMADTVCLACKRETDAERMDN